MADLLFGAALVLDSHRVPLLIGAGICKALGHVLHCNGKRSEQPATNDAIDATPVTITWEGLTCTLSSPDGSSRRLLNGLNGRAQPGRLLAIMGASGSGKTTLLTALAGQVNHSPKVRLEGRVAVNTIPLQQSNHRKAFVQQEDLFFSMLTVRETLELAAQLRLPASMGAEDRAAAVAHSLQALGLVNVADTRVGDAKTRGLSGGEKKRLQIACELIASPKLIFAGAILAEAEILSCEPVCTDEPTSGLDTASAQQVMQSLKDLAAAGHTVVVSIHQPRSSIFAMFDDLLLLAEGREVFHGPADTMLECFEALGHLCPPHFNPAEFVMDLMSLDYSSPEALQASRRQVDGLVAAYAQRATHASMPAPPPSPALPVPRPPLGFMAQLRLLFRRAWQQVTRDKVNLTARAMSNISSALVFGSIFWRMGRAQSTIQDRMGLLQVTAVATAMTSMIKTLNVFPTERTIVNRERSNHAYGISPYLVGKLAAELPVGALFPALFGALVYPATGLHRSWTRFARFLGILTLEAFSAQAMGLAIGALAPSTDAALAIGPAIMLIFIVFGGLYVTPENVPLPLKWLPNVSLIKSAYQALCVNEFDGLTFEAPPGAPGALVDGEQVLARLGFAHKGALRSCLEVQGRILLVEYWLTHRILKAKRPKYQQLVEGNERGR